LTSSRQGQGSIAASAEVARRSPQLRIFAVLTLVALIAAALLIGFAVSAGTTLGFDQAVLLALRVPGDPTTPIGPKWLTEMARDVTALGGVAVLTILTVLVTLQFLLRREWSAAILVAVSAISGTLISNLLKVAFDRPRPALTAIMDYGAGSFPSGHSTASAVVYLTLGMLLAKAAETRRMKVFYVAAAVFLTGLVGVSRLYLGVHYPTDVAAGWSIGAAWALLCRWAASRFDRQDGSQP
jgi:undecaprenyl-diphosphatase